MFINKTAKLLILVATTSLASPAISADPQTAADQTTAPLKNDTGKRVCRVVTPTGSRFTQRLCKTADEWQKDADRAQNQLDTMNRTGEPTFPNRDMVSPR